MSYFRISDSDIPARITQWSEAVVALIRIIQKSEDFRSYSMCTARQIRNCSHPASAPYVTSGYADWFHLTWRSLGESSIHTAHFGPLEAVPDVRTVILTRKTEHAFSQVYHSDVKLDTIRIKLHNFRTNVVRYCPV